jgi:hypothetical protein
MIQKEAELIGSTSYSILGRSPMAEMSPEDKRKSVYGDKKQGDKLVKKKFSTPSYHVSSKASVKLGRT